MERTSQLTITKSNGPIEVREKDAFRLRLEGLWVRHVGDLERPEALLNGEMLEAVEGNATVKGKEKLLSKLAKVGQ